MGEHMSEATDVPGTTEPYPHEGREIYPSAPLRFVASELIFPPVLALQDERMKREIYARLRGLFPVPAAGPPIMGGFGIQLSPGGAVSAAVPPPGIPSPAAGLRVMNRDRTASATVTISSLLVETSAYVRYEEFRDLIRAALEAVAEVDEIPGMQRLGLRYVDEIRLAEIEHPRDWEPYFDSSLHGPIRLLDHANPQVTQGLVEYGIAPQRQLVLRYGATSGWAVDPNGPLRLKTNEDGPYFLLDIDSFWTAPPELLPEYTLESAVSLCNELHAPIRQLFEASITDKLRDVFREEPT
jgi:uncharacterized protein (TIGR04255 family)